VRRVNDISIDEVKEKIFASMIRDGLDPEFVYSIDKKSFFELELELKRAYEIRNARKRIVWTRMPLLRYEFIGIHYFNKI